MVALAEEIYPRYELLVWYGALQALRPMEAVAVRREDMEAVPGWQAVVEQRRLGEPAPLKTAASKASIPVGSFLWGKYEDHMTRWRAPLTEAALRKRERRGSPPIPTEYAHLVTLTKLWKPVGSTLNYAFNRAKEKVRARGIAIPEDATFRDLRHFVDAVLISSGVEPRKVQARMRHAHLSETLDTYGYLVWQVDWENAPASFEELYGIPAPPGLPEAALVPRAERPRSTGKS